VSVQKKRELNPPERGGARESATQKVRREELRESISVQKGAKTLEQRRLGVGARIQKLDNIHVELQSRV